MLSLCSCRVFIDIIRDRYECPVDEVSSVQIIVFDRSATKNYPYGYAVLREIKDYSEFIKRLNDIKTSTVWNDPKPLSDGAIVIKIDYVNGDFDLLDSNAQRFNRNGKNNYGHYVFDEEQFDSLIVDYLQ